jgi:signal transduction histidine kinase
MEVTAIFLPYTDKTGQKYLIMVHASTVALMEMIKATEQTAYIILLFFLVISLIIGWQLSRWIAKPLIGVTKIALKMAKGDFSTLIETNRKDELGDLSKAMNTLSLRLDKTLNSLASANSELTLLLKRWKDFLADVSHELRTPLFLIQGYSEAIMDKVVNDEQTQNEYLSVINKETLRLQKLVNQILEMESGLPLNKVSTNLFALVNDTIRPFEISAAEKKITIAVADSLNNMGAVNLDPDKMGEVIYNLVDNALRYTPENGTVSISGKLLSAETLQLSISDTGVGIPASHLPQLFDRFYRVDKARSRSRGGSGLGLAIVKNIVEQHGGTIEVKSKVNRGTSFTITLPDIN